MKVPHRYSLAKHKTFNLISTYHMVQNTYKIDKHAIAAYSAAALQTAKAQNPVCAGFAAEG